MEVIYAKEALPSKIVKSIFLAGPTPRDKEMKSWRPEALKILEEKGYSGTVFVPEDRDGKTKGSYDDQVEWEWQALERADCILFWIPRDLETMPAFTTNVEFGLWVKSGKIVLGAPKDAPNMRYLKALGEKYDVSQSHTLEDTINNALRYLENKNDNI
ncbi:MAG: nucleoside 2-deoxyribosyltransferase domain-containing protein [Parcubacteria group bacterium]|nr:nucleoside 2-deoxyribosyltransferase domain-containing protein [Parcubacteria group bacterium]